MANGTKKSIDLRVIGFVRDGNFQLICIDTDVAISAKSEAEAKNKMRDALISYFKTFSKEEIERETFIRKSPLKYFVWWRIGVAITFVINIAYFFSSIAKYDSDSHTLKLA